MLACAQVGGASSALPLEELTPDSKADTSQYACAESASLQRFQLLVSAQVLSFSPPRQVDATKLAATLLFVAADGEERVTTGLPISMQLTLFNKRSLASLSSTTDARNHTVRQVRDIEREETINAVVSVADGTDEWTVASLSIKAEDLFLRSRCDTFDGDPTIRETTQGDTGSLPFC